MLAAPLDSLRPDYELGVAVGAVVGVGVTVAGGEVGVAVAGAGTVIIR
jgi:hypothetical protein